MGNVLIMTLFSIFSFCLFDFSNDIVSINRIVSNVPISVFELSIDLINFDENHIYFDQMKLRNNLDTYFKDNVYQYTRKYEIKYTFLNSEDHSICVNGMCNEVRIDFTAILSFDYKLTRGLTYEIWGK